MDLINNNKYTTSISDKYTLMIAERYDVNGTLLDRDNDSLKKIIISRYVSRLKDLYKLHAHIRSWLTWDKRLVLFLLLLI